MKILSCVFIQLFSFVFQALSSNSEQYKSNKHSIFDSLETSIADRDEIINGFYERLLSLQSKEYRLINLLARLHNHEHKLNVQLMEFIRSSRNDEINNTVLDDDHSEKSNEATNGSTTTHSSDEEEDHSSDEGSHSSDDDETSYEILLHPIQ